jgi:hypothetical protein
MQALGTADYDFALGIIKQVSNAAAKSGIPGEDEANFVLSVIRGIEPKDQVETMLAAQMAALSTWLR